MQSKNTTTKQGKQQLPAGVAPNDHNIEFIGVVDTKTVLWRQRGHTNTFKNISPETYEALKELFLTDQEAVAFLPTLHPEFAHDVNRLVEIYTYYMYGQVDSKPDVIEGKLQPCENFRESIDCPSLKFTNKFIDIDGAKLSPRDIQIIDDIANNLPDKMIAHKLGIHLSTYDFHKRNLFKKIGATTKLQVLKKAILNQVLCED